MEEKNLLQNMFFNMAETLSYMAFWLPDITTTLYTALILMGTYLLYWLFFVPMEHVKDLTQLGYGHLENEAKKRGKKLVDLVNNARYLQSRGEMPPIYPNGWFVLCASNELKKGEVKNIDALGQMFAVFRAMDGTAHVMDAYCPHMGANIAIGGKVIGNCIQCPFHGWQFNGSDGKCVKVPYSKEIPDQSANIKRWHTLERNDNVHVWFHAENEPPSWEPYVLEELKSCTFRGRTENIVNTHVQDISENAVDVGHLYQIHACNVMAGVDLNDIHKPMWKFATHEYTTKWNPNDPPNSHTSLLEIGQIYKILGIPVVDVDLRITQVGPAIVYFNLKTLFGTAWFTMSYTPIGPLELRIIHKVYSSSFMPAPFAKMLLLFDSIQFERDIAVFNSKKYALKPILVKEESSILRHRRWYSQFYSENSPRFSYTKENSLW